MLCLGFGKGKVQKNFEEWVKQQREIREEEMERIENQRQQQNDQRINDNLDLENGQRNIITESEEE